MVVTIANPPVNAMSSHARAGLIAALDYAAQPRGIKAVVLTGAGKVFVGGADIKEFSQTPSRPSLIEVVDRIENFAKPVIAAINGAALGGGCEIALACHGRTAGKTSKLGLPEVNLGIVPGAGGTQRLPRLVGILAAIDMIASGRSVAPDEALQLGLIECISENPVADAIALAHQMKRLPLKRTGALVIAPEDAAAIDLAANKVLSRARGQTAPAEAIRLVKAASGLSLEDGLAEERATFQRLRNSRESAALRHVFFAERAAAKVSKLEGVEPLKVETVGIVGLGLMGSGIAVAALAAGYRVVGVDRTRSAVDEGIRRIARILQKTVQSSGLSGVAFDDALCRLTAITDMHALADADLVIEAVFDDLAVKVDLFRYLDGIVRPDAILATNTSYLNPDEIAGATTRPKRVVGMHFFSPANIMRLAEVVDCRATLPEVLATVLTFARKLGKLPIVCGVTEGFIGNRIYSAYRREAEVMVEDGAAVDQVDAALEGWGFPMGIFAVNDMAGLEIAWARRKRQAASRDPSERYVEIADRLCEAGRFGRKSGRGWYDYTNGVRRVDSEVAKLIAAVRAARGIAARDFTAEEIVSRLLKTMADEGKVLCATGIAARASDIDLVMINGYGFPAHKGGPMFHAGIA